MGLDGIKVTSNVSTDLGDTTSLIIKVNDSQVYKSGIIKFTYSLYRNDTDLSNEITCETFILKGRCKTSIEDVYVNNAYTLAYDQIKISLNDLGLIFEDIV